MCDKEVILSMEMVLEGNAFGAKDFLMRISYESILDVELCHMQVKGDIQMLPNSSFYLENALG